MANKLPFDDEQAMLLNDEIKPRDIPVQMELDEIDTHKTPGALKYFTNVDNSIEQEEGDQSLVGKMVGQKYNKPLPKIPLAMPSIDNDNQSGLNLDEQISSSTNEPIKSKQQSLLEQYKQLMDQRTSRNQDLNMQQGANQIAQAIASGYGAKIGDGSELINQMRKQTDMPVEQFMGQDKVMGLKNDLEINDANSDISAFARNNAIQAMKRLNPNMTPEQVEQLQEKFSGMTAKQLEQIGFKGIGGMSEYQRLQMDAQRERLNYLGENLEFKKNQQGEKISKEDSDLAQKMQKALSSMEVGARNEVGRLARIAGSARQLNTLFRTNSPEKFGKLEMRELANITNSMLTGGGTTAIRAIDELVPHTFAGDTANFLSYIQNKPVSVEAQDFAKGFKKIADRELASSDLALRKILGSNIHGFYKLAERQPEVYNKILESKINLNSDVNEIFDNPDVVKKSQEVIAEAKKSSPSAKKDSTIEKYAKKINVDYNQAKSILTKRGYKPNE
jgi:hypothetical protein